jgi:hypothetical protein
MHETYHNKGDTMVPTAPTMPSSENPNSVDEQIIQNYINYIS